MRGVRVYRPVHAHIHTHVQCIHSTHTRVCICMHTCVCAHVHAHSHMHTHTHTRTRTSRDPGMSGGNCEKEPLPQRSRVPLRGWGRECTGPAWASPPGRGGARGPWTPLRGEAVIRPVPGRPRSWLSEARRCIRVSPSFRLCTFPRPRPQVLTGRGHQERVPRLWRRVPVSVRRRSLRDVSGGVRCAVWVCLGTRPPRHPPSPPPAEPALRARFSAVITGTVRPLLGLGAGAAPFPAGNLGTHMIAPWQIRVENTCRSTSPSHRVFLRQEAQWSFPRAHPAR